MSNNVTNRKPKPKPGGKATQGKVAKPSVRNASAAGQKDKVSETPRPLVEDVVATKMMRDIAVRERVYLNNRITIVMAAALSLSIAGNVLLATRSPDVRYFATDPVGKIMQLTSLDQPIQSVNEVLSWSTNAITSAYTFSFSNYRQELQRSRDYFTNEGWKGFQQALQDSGNLNAVITNKYVTTAVPRGAPVVVGEGYVSGKYAWKIEVPILVTYQSAKARTTQDLLVQALVVRRPELEHPKGIGIAQIIAQ